MALKFYQWNKRYKFQAFHPKILVNFFRIFFFNQFTRYNSDDLAAITSYKLIQIVFFPPFFPRMVSEGHSIAVKNLVSKSAISSTTSTGIRECAWVIDSRLSSENLFVHLAGFIWEKRGIIVNGCVFFSCISNGGGGGGIATWCRNVVLTEAWLTLIDFIFSLEVLSV